MHYKVKIIKDICYGCKARMNYGKNPTPDFEPSVYKEFMSIKVAFYTSRENKD